MIGLSYGASNREGARQSNSGAGKCASIEMGRSQVAANVADHLTNMAMFALLGRRLHESVVEVACFGRLRVASLKSLVELGADHPE